MKTTFFALLFLLSFFFSCERGASLESLPNDAGEGPAVMVDTPAASASCPHPEYDPPDVVPGMDCQDPCQFVYEGWVDFGREELVVNCRQLPLSSPALSFSIDSTIIRYVGIGFLKVLRIQAPGIGAWCMGRVFFRAEGCPEPSRVFLHVDGNGMSEYRVAWLEDFWGCAAGKRVNFRLIARNPLGLEGEP